MLDWQTYIEIADNFQHRARFEDRPDLRQDIITRLAELASNDGDKPLSKPSMLRIASYVVMEYWRDLKRLPDLYSLNDDVEDDEGNRLEIYQTLADDRAIDLDDWLDCKTWLRGCPKRLVRIAIKRATGKPLNHTEQVYLNRYRKKDLAKLQKSLF